MEKINALVAMNKWLKGEAVTLCPSKCYPNTGHPFNCAIEIQQEKVIFNREAGIKEWKRIGNEFNYYNCDEERGEKTHYYY